MHRTLTLTLTPTLATMSTQVGTASWTPGGPMHRCKSFVGSMHWFALAQSSDALFRRTEYYTVHFHESDQLVMALHPCGIYVWFMVLCSCLLFVSHTAACRRQHIEPCAETSSSVYSVCIKYTK